MRAYNERRKKEIGKWIDEGKTIKWIAMQLCVTVYAVYKFISRERRRENSVHVDNERRRNYIGHSVNQLSNELRWKVWERDNFTCRDCGMRKYLSVDHINPLVYGGKTELNNLQTLCMTCNSKKGKSKSVQFKA